MLVRQGDVALHKEQTSMGQHGGDHAGNFTQVRAAVRRKTLLLLWWIVVENAALSPGKIASGREQLRAYECTRVQILSMLATALLL